MALDIADQKLSKKDFFEAVYNQAVTGDPERALELAEKSMERFPEVPQLKAAIATAKIRAGKYDDVSKLLNICEKKNYLSRKKINFLRAQMLWQTDAQDKAIAILRRGKNFNADNEIYLAALYASSNELAEAEGLYRKVLEHEPENLEAYRGYLQMLMKWRKYDHIGPILDKAKKTFPDNKTIKNFELNYLFSIGDWANLELKTRDYIEEQGAETFVVHFLSQAVWEAGRPQDALEILETYKDMLSSYPLLITTKASILRSIGRIDECIEVLNETRDSFPDNPKYNKAIWNRCILDLSCGNLKAGMPVYKKRFNLNENFTENRTFKAKPWQWQPLKANEKLMLWREQGVGDCLAFLSLIDELNIPHEQLILEIDNKLVPLIDHSFPNIAVRGPQYNRDYSQNIFDYDHQIALGELLPKYRPSLDAFDHQPQRYINPNKQITHDFDSWFAGLGQKPKIGICWRSSNVQGNRQKHYYTLDELEPMFRSIDAHYISLQYDDDQPERSEFFNKTGLRILKHPDLNQFDDLNGTAALIDNLDFVVTVGTAVQNIAGALGKPTVVLGLKGSYWFFGKDRRNIFTQPVHPNSEVFSRYASDPKHETVDNLIAYMKSFLMFI